MDFATPVKRRTTESVVPMINVVFLLLIFFLMTSELAPPEPIEVTPPEAEGESADKAPAILYVGPDGTLAYGDLRGEAAVTAFAEAAADAPRLRADAGLGNDADGGGEALRGKRRLSRRDLTGWFGARGRFALALNALTASKEGERGSCLRSYSRRDDVADRARSCSSRQLTVSEECGC